MNLSCFSQPLRKGFSSASSRIFPDEIRWFLSLVLTFGNVAALEVKIALKPKTLGIIIRFKYICDLKVMLPLLLYLTLVAIHGSCLKLNKTLISHVIIY